MNPLKAKLLGLIASEGPITVARYMEVVLGDPDHGYYMRRDPLGAAGDFITAPEISQIFGELIGLFFVQAWEDRGHPRIFSFVELGPGRGTLMADILRAAKIRPEFGEAARIALVETSPALRAVQERTLPAVAARWSYNLDAIPDDAPLFLVANEFFDALPIRQFVKQSDGWHERLIGCRADDLVFALATAPSQAPFITEQLHNAPDGAVFETCPGATKLAAQIARRIAARGGVALIIDYGHPQPGFGDTFQAMRHHAYADPLAQPGEADLTAHVDFAALGATAREADAAVFGPIPQSAFLESLGIRERAERLKHAAPEHARDIGLAVERLTSPAQMGSLFKVMAISDGRSSPPPGFAS